MRGLKRSGKLIAVLLVLLTCLGFSPWAMSAEKAEAATDPTTIFSSSEHGGWVVSRDIYGTVNSVALSGAATDSFEWSGNSCDVVLDSATAPDATVTLSTVISGRFVSNCYMKYNSTAKKGANTSFAVQLSDGSATVTLKPYYNRETMSGTTKTINITTAEDLGEVTEISITNPPDKTEYYATQTFDPTGMVVTATYDSGETRTIKNSNLEFSPSVVQNDTTEITVSYEGFEATQPITVIQLPKSSAMIDYSTSNGSLDRVDIQNADGTALEEVTGITIDGTTINVSLDRAIDKSAQVKAVFTLTQNNNLPFLSTNNTMRAGNYKSTTYSTTLSNGNGSATAYLYNVNPTATNNPYVTFRVVYRTQNDPPNRRAGVDQSTNETVVAESPFTLYLSQIFEDPDNDELTYKVAIDDANPVNAEEQYSFLTNQKGSHKLVFSATDEYNAVSTDTYTVNLTVERKEGTHYITHTNGTGYTTEAAEGSHSPVNTGESYKLKITFAKGYERDENFAVKANGVAIPEDGEGSNTFTITNISEDQEVTVEGIRQILPCIIAPAGSTITLGYGPGNSQFFKYFWVDPVKTETLSDGRVKNSYEPITNNYLYYRVENPDGVMYWNYFATKMEYGDVFEVTKAKLNMDNDSFKSDTVYPNFEQNNLDIGDMYLNINPQNYLALEPGGTFDIHMKRNWYAVNSFSNDKVALPITHYEVVDINGNDSDLVTVEPDEYNSAKATLTAGNHSGMAIVKVKYDAMYFEQAYGSSFGAGGSDPKRLGATWPERTGIIVVTVGQDGSDIKTNMTINEGRNTGYKAAGDMIDVENDPLFYIGKAGAEYSFKPEDGAVVTIARATVSASDMTYNGFTSEGVETDDEGKVTVKGLTSGRHIIKVEKDGLANYQVVTARGASVILSDSQGNEVDIKEKIFNPGDKVTIQYDGLTSPAEKLTRAYNFNFRIGYFGEDGNEQLARVIGGIGQYNFSSDRGQQNITITIPEDWNKSTYALTKGTIRVGGMSGDQLKYIGDHRKVQYGMDITGLSGNGCPAALGMLPEFTFKVQQPPVRKEGVEAEVDVNVEEGNAYNADLSEIFEDPNGDDLTYTVSINGADPVSADENYSYTPEGKEDPVTLVFKANDGKADSTDTYTVKITVTAHTHSMTGHPAVAATCTTTGNSEYYSCDKCSKFFSDEAGETEIEENSWVIAIDPNAHKWGDFTEAKPATCVKQGQKVRVCEHNEEHKDYLDVDLLDHQLTKTNRVEATCLEDGNVDFWTCSGCSQFFSDEEGKTVIGEDDVKIPAIGHKWGDWKVTKKATEHAEGEETRRCEHDDTHFETRTIDKLPPVKPTDTVKKVLVAKGIAKGKTKGKISWNNVKADRYIVYLSLCDHKGKTYNYKKAKTVSGKTYTWTKGKLKKNVWYKFKVVAQKKVNGKYKNIATSKPGHIVIGNVKGKYTNPKSLKLSKSKISLKAGKTTTIKGTVTKVKKKKALGTAHASKLRFISNNPKVAIVNAKGKVTAKSKGTATIYVQTINGIWKTCKVTVK